MDSGGPESVWIITSPLITAFFAKIFNTGGRLAGRL
jgi:hypothetical protein